MKTKSHSPHKLSATGVGPKIFRSMLPFLLAGIAIQIFYPSVSAFPALKAEVLNTAGWVLLATGLIFWGCSIVQFIMAFPKGVYSISRNPIYVSWILFILPGLAGIWNNWVFLLAALAMYIALQKFIPAEEKMLEKVFDESYRDYAKKVNRVIF